MVDVTGINRPGGSAKLLEEIEVSRAMFEAFEGAVVCINYKDQRSRNVLKYFAVHTSRSNFHRKYITKYRMITSEQ